MQCVCMSKESVYFENFSANEVLNAAFLLNLNVIPSSRLLFLLTPLSKHFYRKPQASKNRAWQYGLELLSFQFCLPTSQYMVFTQASICWKMTFKIGINISWEVQVSACLYWSAFEVFQLFPKVTLAASGCFRGNRNACFQHVEKRHLCLFYIPAPPRDVMFLPGKQKALIFK